MPPAIQESAQTPEARSYGSGACVLDYDGDGRPDIFLVNADGSGRPGLITICATANSKTSPPIRHNDSWRRNGLPAGDFDNDGHPDLAVSFDDGIALFTTTVAANFKTSPQALEFGSRPGNGPHVRRLRPRWRSRSLRRRTSAHAAASSSSAAMHRTILAQ